MIDSPRSFSKSSEITESDCSSTSDIYTPEYVTCQLCAKNKEKSRIRKHMESVIHTFNVRIADFALERSRKLINSTNIFIDSSESPDTNSYCDICNEDFDANDHDNSVRHKKLSIYQALLPKLSIILEDVENNLHLLDEMKDILNKLNKLDVVKEDDKSKSGIGKVYCEVCKSYQSTIGFSKHLISGTHIKNHINSVSNGANFPRIALGTTYCEVCKIHKNAKMFRSHLICKTHVKKCYKKNIPIPVIEGYNFCKMCRCYYHQKLDVHVKSEKHKRDMIGINLDHDANLIIAHDTKYIVDGNISNKFCKICNNEINNDLNKHIHTRKHIVTYGDMIEDNNIIKLLHEYFCGRCDLFFDNIVDHLKYYCIRMKNREIYCKICKADFANERIAAHVKSNDHRYKQKLYLQIPKIHYINVDSEIIKNYKSMITVKDKVLCCKECDLPLSVTDDIIQHFENNVHLAKNVKDSVSS